MEAFGLPDDEATNNLLQAYQDGDVAKMTDLLQKQLDSGKKAEILAENLIKTIIKNPQPKLLPLLERLPDVKAPFPEAKILLAFLAEAAEKPVLHVSAPNQAHTALKPQTAPEPQIEAKKEVQETQPIQEKTEKRAKTASVDFDENDYAKKVRAKNPALFSILKNCSIQQNGNVVSILTENNAYRNILKKPNNIAVLQVVLPDNLQIEISETTDLSTKKENLGKISDIMGRVTEVKTDGNPF